MHTYISIILCLLGAEFGRRVILALICAFTGPLSKIPGPFWNKLSPIPWAIQNLTGNSMNVAPKYFEKYGKVIRVGPRDVLVAEKSGVQKILIDDDLVKSHVYENLKLSPGVTSLITERDKVKYRHKRKLISPGFSISYLNGLEPLMKECVDVMERCLDQKCEESGGEARVDMSQMLGNLTSDIMAATSFGGSSNLVRTNDRKLKNLVMDRLKRAALSAQLPFIDHLPFGLAPKMDGYHGLNAVIDRIVEKRREEGEEGRKRDLLQILVDLCDDDGQEEEGWGREWLREEMSLFMIAGSDTSSATATFTILLLLNNRDKLEKLIRELDDAFEIEDEITFKDTQELPYLNAVIRESMRRMPIVALGLARWTEEATVISGFEIPEGTIVSPAIGQLMRDSEIWPEPEEFVPERWLESSEEWKGGQADRKAFHPFSAGSRMCPGQQFALKELRLILATLVRRYELSLVEGQSHEMRLHTVPWLMQGGYWVGVRRRKD